VAGLAYVREGRSPLWARRGRELAEVGPPELTAALVEYARIELAGVVTPCLETPRTRAKRFHAALRRVLRGAGRPVHGWEYRGRD